jgi:hypothetical protein
MNTEFRSSRRRFIKRAAIFGALAALFVRTRPVTAGAKEPMPQSNRSSQGYRLTEHVKRYYETARL